MNLKLALSFAVPPAVSFSAAVPLASSSFTLPNLSLGLMITTEPVWETTAPPGAARWVVESTPAFQPVQTLQSSAATAVRSSPIRPQA